MGGNSSILHHVMDIEMLHAAAIRCSSVSEVCGYGLEDRVPNAQRGQGFVC